ncbi:MAG TPA: SusC/RagA family TonB-linked outer membrane protein [Chitinophagaceae bacterium]|nr:SusC/RagA family TonB-linked outer membrane protein [Chitinophagaceae bacterium]
MRKKFLLSGIFLLSCLFSIAQQKTITGKVSSDTGTPLAGASVTVVGQKIGVRTAADGTFSINVPASAKALQITYVGSTPQIVDITSTSDVTVTLQSVAQALSDVVVTGYGTTRKKDLTGAVSQIAAKDFTNGNLSNPAQLFQGKIPGVVVTVPGGDPNSTVSIRLRGVTSLSGGQSPLIVVDGVPLDDPNTFADIPADDIASIDVLKDASASAIYGSRAANGVLVVNTKKGVSGRTTVTYDGSVSVDKVAKLYPMANASQWKEGYTKLLTAQGASSSDIATAIAGYDHGGNTDWQKALTRNGFSTNHDISISGGERGFSYRASANYLTQQGVVINSGRNQLGLRFTAQQKALNDKLTLQVGIINSTTNRDLTDYNIFYEAYSSPPVYPVKNADGSYFAYTDFALQNPVQQQAEETDKGIEKLTIMNAVADYEIIHGLKIGVRGSSSKFNDHIEFFEPVFPLVGNTNVGAIASSNNNSMKGDIHINFEHHWNKSNLSAIAVYEYNDFNYDGSGAVATNLLLDDIGAWSLQSAPQAYQHAYSTRNESQLISYLGRAAYDWDQRYYLTASIRADGSSKFGPSNAWGYFPSVSVAWRLSNESFMKNLTWLNEFKINAGWGKTGDQENIDPYSKLQLYGPTGSYYNASSGLWLTEYGPTQNANPDLQWEQRVGRNIGFNFAVMQNRLTGAFNYFSDKSTKLLYTYTIPFPSPGAVVNTLLANVGTMTNKGAEFNLDYQVIRHQDFSWNLSGNISSVKTKITSLSGSFGNGVSTYELSTDQVSEGSAQGRGLSGAPITYLKVGYTPYVFWMPHYVGLDKDGNEQYAVDGGTTTTDVLKATNYYTDPAPKFTYGFASTFDYKKFELSFFLRGVAGGKIFDNSRMVLDNINRFAGNNATVDALTNGITNPPQASDHWLENASFLRMDNMSLAYTIKPKSVFQAIKLYVATNNLFVITKYRGLDPEVYLADNAGNVMSDALGSAGVANSFSPGGSVGPYIDAAYSGSGYYPKTRSYSFGINVTLK